jgi:hypothetical protein
MTRFDMPSLTDVQGDVTIRSAVPLNCSSLDVYNQQRVLKARYLCESGTGEPLDSSSSADDSSHSSSKGGDLSGGAKAGIAVGVVGAVALIALVAFFCWRRAKKSRDSHQSRHTAGAVDGKDGDGTVGSTEQYTKPELSAEGVQKVRSELHGDSTENVKDSVGNGNVAELAGGAQARYELPAAVPGRHS